MEKTFPVEIQPGYKDGTKIKYPATSDFPKEVVFVLREKPHKYFQRQGDDLKWTCQLTAQQVERGVFVRIPLLDGSELKINSKEYSVRQGSRISFPGFGMPISSSRKSSSSSSGGSTPIKAGNLIVKFDIMS